VEVEKPYYPKKEGYLKPRNALHPTGDSNWQESNIQQHAQQLAAKLMKGGITLFVAHLKCFKINVVRKQNQVIAKRVKLELATTLGTVPCKLVITLNHV
jgi:hypothetical protein